MHSNGNGNGHKPHHIKNLDKVSKTSLKAAAVLSNGSPTKMGKMLGIDPSTAHYHLQKKELSDITSSARAEAIKKAKLSLVKAYKRVDEALDAKQTGFGKTFKTPDHDIRLKAAKQTHEIYHPKEADVAESGRAVVIMPVIVVDGNPLKFKVGNNG